MVNRSKNAGRSSNLAGIGQKKRPAATRRAALSNRKMATYLLMAVLLIGGGSWIALGLAQSEEKRVRKSFHLLAEAMSKESGESIFTLDQKMKNIASLLDETCEIKIPAYGLSDALTRDEITGYVVRGRLYYSQLHVKFLDVEVAFPETGLSKVRLTARVTGKTTAGETVNEAHEIECILKKMENKWIVSAVEAIEVLKK